MSIERRGANSWRVQTQVRAPSGAYRWVRRTLKFPPTMTEKQQLREARLAEAQLIREAAQEADHSNSLTFSDFSILYLRRHCGQLSPVTRSRYKYILDMRILPDLGDMLLEDIDADVLNKWMDDLRSTDLEPSTIRGYFRLLDSILSIAVKWEYLTVNPMDRLDRPRARARETASLTEAQLRKLMQDIKTEPCVSHRAGVILAALCGLRLGECCGLRLTDIDFDNNTIRISHARKYSPITGNITAEPKTASSRRLIACPPAVMEVLREDAAELDLIERGVRAWKPGNDYIIHNEDGSPQAITTLSKWWARWAPNHALAGVRFHDLRHTHASILIANNIDPVTVSKRLGHSSTATTLQIYAHALQRRDEESAAVINNVLNPVTDHK